MSYRGGANKVDWHVSFQKLNHCSTEERYARNNFDRRLGSDTDWCIARVAAQSTVGLLPELRVPSVVEKACGFRHPAGALYAWGVVLSPAVGAALMAASTVIVAINARLLRLKK